jgi:hypothetical protein
VSLIIRTVFLSQLPSTSSRLKAMKDVFTAALLSIICYRTLRYTSSILQCMDLGLMDMQVQGDTKAYNEGAWITLCGQMV